MKAFMETLKVSTSRLVRLPEALARSGLSKSTLYRLEKAGRFPQKIRVGERMTAFRESELEDWLAAQPRATDAQPERAA